MLSLYPFTFELMIESERFPLIAKTMAELEDVLAEELIALGADNVEIGTRMVSFTGDKALMYKANIHCRTALRILKPIYNFKAETADEVYEALKQVNWEDYLGGQCGQDGQLLSEQPHR